MALAGALCAVAHVAVGLHQSESLCPGEPAARCLDTTYDLRRVRLNGLVRRLPHFNTYHLPAGVGWAVLYTKVHNRLLGPLLAADQPPAPSTYDAPYASSKEPSTTTSTTPAPTLRMNMTHRAR